VWSHTFATGHVSWPPPVALTAAIVELPFIARLDSWTIVIGVLSFPAILVVDVIAVLNVYFFFGGSK
jgi:hypothetical protein